MSAVLAPEARPTSLMAAESVATPTVATMVLDNGSMDSMVRLAEIMAEGKATLPAEYRGNRGDCLAVVMQAVQWKMNPFALAQKTHFISGKIGYEAQAISAAINTTAPIKERLRFEWYGPWENVIGKYIEKQNSKGDTYRKLASTLADEKGVGIKVWGTLIGEDEPRVLDLLLMQAGVRNSTLWADDPRQQLAYLAIKRWCRLHTPEVIMGVYTPDELEEGFDRAPPEYRDMGAADVVGETTAAQNLSSKIRGGPAPEAKPKATLLDDVLKQIREAQNADDLGKAREAGEKLTNEDDMSIARTAYQKRKRELLAAAKGESGANSEDPAAGVGDSKDAAKDTKGPGGAEVTYASVLDEINGTTVMNADREDYLRSLIKRVKDLPQQGELAGHLAAKIDDLKK